MFTAIDFIRATRYADLPPEARHHARRCLLDLIGVAAAGVHTLNGRLLADHAADFHSPGRYGARLLFDGRRVSPMGAAMANAAAIDSFDAHDGHRLTKGHAGVVVLPAALAFMEEAAPCDAEEFLVRLVIGYEIGVRAGIALHRSVSDYHTSGAWNALAAAAVGARALKLDREATRHALGTAEYYGPRSQMMRVIDHPTMLKDGATLGAFTGVSAAFLAQRGFTGAPALTVESESVGDIWADLGTRWTMTEQYLKPYPVCRWAQPAIEAALSLRSKLGQEPPRRIVIHTFHEAARLAARAPADTEQAQYSLPFPVAAAFVHGKVGASEIDGPGLQDATVLALSRRIELAERDDFNARFPAERWAEVEIETADRQVLSSGPTTAAGDPEDPLSDDAVEAKFHEMAGIGLDEARRAEILGCVRNLGEGGSARALVELLMAAGAPRAVAESA